MRSSGTSTVWGLKLLVYEDFRYYWMQNHRPSRRSSSSYYSTAVQLLDPARWFGVQNFDGMFVEFINEWHEPVFFLNSIVVFVLTSERTVSARNIRQNTLFQHISNNVQYALSIHFLRSDQILWWPAYKTQSSPILFFSWKKKPPEDLCKREKKKWIGGKVYGQSGNEQRDGEWHLRMCSRASPTRNGNE